MVAHFLCGISLSAVVVSSSAVGGMPLLCPSKMFTMKSESDVITASVTLGQSLLTLHTSKVAQ